MIVSTVTQDRRLLTLETPLGAGALLLRSFSMTEEISSLFTMQMELVSEGDPVELDAILGQPIGVTLEPEGEPRLFHGLVSRFGYTGHDDRFHYYFAEAVPWLWLLTRQADCRVFQNLTVPEIVEKVFTDRGFSDFRFALKRSYSKLDYSVQYRETDFNFVARLLEEEGIFYFFEHQEDRHTLVLGDSPLAHLPCPGQTQARFEPEGGVTPGEETVTFWQEEQELRTGRFTHRDHHFQLPDRKLEFSEPSIVAVRASSPLEVYDYPGEYAERFNQPGARLDAVEPEGRKLAKARMEEEEATHRVIRGSSTCRAFTAGTRFDLVDYPTRGPVLLTSVQHTAEQAAAFFSAGGGGGGAGGSGGCYSNTFTAIPHATPFRPRRATRRPFVQGPQTAVVVGPPGEEIHVDKFGRVKVQFFWDREGKHNDLSSCWVRVAQSMAGKRWGSFFWPRVGQEVVVSFLEGNPDQPLVTGSVYNAQQMPPYLGNGPDPQHPHNPRVSGFKSNSTKGGEGFSEIRFDDTRDKEQLFLHAQNRKDERVGGSSYTAVGGDRHLRVEGDSFTKVTGNQHVAVTGFHSEKIDGFEAHYVVGEQDLMVDESKWEYIGADSHLVVCGSSYEAVDATKNVRVAGSLHQKVGANHVIEATNQTLWSQIDLVLESAGTVTLKVGGNFIEISSSGIKIQGDTVEINCGGTPAAGWDCLALMAEEAAAAIPYEADEADGAKTGTPSAPDAEVVPRKAPPKKEAEPEEPYVHKRHQDPNERSPVEEPTPPAAETPPIPPTGGL